MDINRIDGEFVSNYMQRRAGAKGVREEDVRVVRAPAKPASSTLASLQNSHMKHPRGKMR